MFGRIFRYFFGQKGNKTSKGESTLSAAKPYSWVEIPWSAATVEQKDAEMQRLDAIFQETGLCPDCGQGKLLRGPEAGCAVNVRCNYCHRCFNAAYGAGAHFEVGLWDRIRVDEQPTPIMVRVKVPAN